MLSFRALALGPALVGALLFAGCDSGSTDEPDADAVDGGAAADGGTATLECTDGCLVAGRCFPDGVSDPTNPCSICDTARAQTTFSTNDGATCDDGEFCTEADTCSAGACSGTARACDDGIACNGVATCDEESSACVAGTPTCVTGELCDAASGACVLECSGCLVDGMCYGDGQTNSLNPCQVCSVATSRSDWSPNDGASCDDGLFCTDNDVCTGTTCGGTTRSCDDSVSCNGAESCNETNDRCEPGTPTCTGGELCDTGTDMCVLTCVGGSTLCGTSCTDTDVDANNCGSCGRACAASQRCITGGCQDRSLSLQPAVSFTSAGAVDIDTDDVIGFVFTIGASDVFVGELGVYDDGGDGLAQAHPVGLYELSSTNLVASATIPAGTAATLVDGFRYMPISLAHLAAGAQYVVLAYRPMGATEPSTYRVGGLTTSTQITYDHPTFANVTGGLTFVATDSGLASGFFGPNIKLLQ